MQYLDAISETTEWSLFPRQTIQYHSNPIYAPTSNAEEGEVEWVYEDLQILLELTSKKDVLFIIGDWNAKEGSQEILGVTGRFGLGEFWEAPRDSGGYRSLVCYSPWGCEESNTTQWLNTWHSNITSEYTSNTHTHTHKITHSKRYMHSNVHNSIIYDCWYREVSCVYQQRNIYIYI